MPALSAVFPSPTPSAPSSAVFPLGCEDPTAPEPKRGDFWARAAREQRRMLFGSLVLSACALPCVVALAVVINQDVDTLVEHGVDVRLLSEREDAVRYTSAPWLSGALWTSFLACLAANLSLVERLRGVTPTLWLNWGLLAFPVAYTAIYVTEYDATVARRAVILTGVLAVLLTMRRTVGSDDAITCGLVMWQMLTPTLTQAFYGSVLPHVVASGYQLGYRVLVHPLIVELAVAPMRHAVARMGGGASQALGLVSLYVLVQSAVVGRAVLMAMAPGEQTLAVLLTGMVEALMRTTMRQRDRWYVSVALGAMDSSSSSGSRAREITDSPRAVRARALMLALEELCESMATVLAAAALVAFRLGLERVAPEAAAIVLAGVLQLVLEQLVDLVPPAIVCLHWERARAQPLSLPGRMRALQAARMHIVHNVHPSVRRLACVFIIVIVAPTITALFDVNSAEHLFCPWSRQDGGWWHRVPCVSASEWVG